MQRAHWGSRLGFILAAAGSAVGLGNIWKFPYVAGENGGGWFVLIYLICVAVIGLPIMMAEIFVGRSAQKAPVGAYREMSRPGSPWILAGWMGVACAFIILSFYSVVAGWSMHYVFLSVTNAFSGMDEDAFAPKFMELYAHPSLNIFWHVLFMVLTVGIVIGGIKAGLERWAKILMPALFLMLIVLLIRSMTMSGFRDALDFTFGPRASDLTAGGVLAALGQAFFSLSLGMGALITYGSYLRRDDDLVSTAGYVTVLDTGVALMACLILFPITFTYGLDPSETVGLVFINMPLSFSQMTGGAIWAVIFFILLTFAALTSAISLLEVAVSYFIDERGWSRAKATVTCGAVVTLFGIPSALSGGTDLFGAKFQSLTKIFDPEGKQGFSWFDTFDKLSSNWMLPLGGLAIALLVAWRVGGAAREQGFKAGSKFGALYWGWVQLLRWIVPIGVILVLLNAVGVFNFLGSGE